MKDKNSQPVNPGAHPAPEDVHSKDTSKPGREEEVINQHNDKINSTAEKMFKEGLADNSHTDTRSTDK